MINDAAQQQAPNVSGNSMTDFKSRYIYPIFIFRLIGLLVLIATISVFIFIGIPSLTKQHSGLKAFGLISIGLLLFAYLIIMLGKSTLTQRYSVLKSYDQVILHDNLFGRHIALDENFKGFSLSSYADKRSVFDFKTLVFYFSNGKKVEMPQFLYSNFKDIIPWLTEQHINFLGHEPYKWKNLFSRHYYFE